MITIATLVALQMLLPDDRVEMITYSQIKSLLKQGLIAEVVIAQESIRGTIKPGGNEAGPLHGFNVFKRKICHKKAEHANRLTRRLIFGIGFA